MRLRGWAHRLGPSSPPCRWHRPASRKRGLTAAVSVSGSWRAAPRSPCPARAGAAGFFFRLVAEREVRRRARAAGHGGHRAGLRRLVGAPALGRSAGRARRSQPVAAPPSPPFSCCTACPVPSSCSRRGATRRGRGRLLRVHCRAPTRRPRRAVPAARRRRPPCRSRSAACLPRASARSCAQVGLSCQRAGWRHPRSCHRTGAVPTTVPCSPPRAGPAAAGRRAVGPRSGALASAWQLGQGAVSSYQGTRNSHARPAPAAAQDVPGTAEMPSRSFASARARRCRRPAPARAAAPCRRAARSPGSAGAAQRNFALDPARRGEGARPARRRPQRARHQRSARVEHGEATRNSAATARGARRERNREQSTARQR
jgi:hypothetical protein